MSLFWRRCKRFSPILCRLLARHKGGAALTTNEIAMRCFLLSAWQVEQLSQSTSWDGVSIDHFREFTQACRVDPSDARQMRRVEDYLSKRKRPKFSYLQRNKLWLTYYKPLMQKWLAAQAPKPLPPPTPPTSKSKA